MNYNDQQQQQQQHFMQQQQQQIRQPMPPNRMMGQPGMMSGGMRPQYINQGGPMPNQMQQGMPSQGMPSQGMQQIQAQGMSSQPQMQQGPGMPPMNRSMTNPMQTMPQLNRSNMPNQMQQQMPMMNRQQMMQQQSNQEGSPYNQQEIQHNAGPPRLSLSLQDILAQMPAEARHQFEAETNPENKNMMIKHYSHRIQQMQHQQQQQQYSNQFDQQQGQMQGGIQQNMNMPMGTPQQRIKMEHHRPNFPQQIQRVPSQGTFQINSNQSQFQQASTPQQYIIRTPQQQVPQQTPQPVQNVVLKHSPMPPQSVSTGPGSLPQRTGPPSVGNIQQPRSMHSNYANSPQIAQPASVQNAAPTPRPAPTPAPIDINEPEYKKVLGELKSYQKETKILIERVRVDGHDTLEKSLIRVLEIMEGKREVDIKLLNKLLSNLKLSIRQHNPMKTMLDFANRVTVVPQAIDSPILPEGWDQLDQFKIKVPSPVLKHVEKVREQELQTKKQKLSEESTMELSDDKEAFCEVACVYQNSAKLKLSKEVSDELLCYNFSIDPSGVPISEYATSVQVLIEFKPKELDSFKYSIPPLRLNIPVNDYPKNAIQLITMHEDDYSPLQLRIVDALKKNTTDEIMHSITKLVNLWRKTVIQTFIPSTDIESRRLIST